MGKITPSCGHPRLETYAEGIISVTPQNVDTYGLFCVKNKKNPGYESKLRWFLEEHPKGLRLKILQDEAGRQLGFIEYTAAEHAWRPVGEITEAAIAQSAPSGFGVFALLKDGQLLEGHYISKTRFKNILQSA